MGTPSRDLQNSSGRAQEQTHKLKLDMVVATFFLPDLSVPGLFGKELSVSLKRGALHRREAAVGYGLGLKAALTQRHQGPRSPKAW